MLTLYPRREEQSLKNGPAGIQHRPIPNKFSLKGFYRLLGPNGSPRTDGGTFRNPIFRYNSFVKKNVQSRDKKQITCTRTDNPILLIKKKTPAAIVCEFAATFPGRMHVAPVLFMSVFRTKTRIRAPTF